MLKIKPMSIDNIIEHLSECIKKKFQCWENQPSPFNMDQVVFIGTAHVGDKIAIRMIKYFKEKYDINIKLIYTTKEAKNKVVVIVREDVGLGYREMEEITTLIHPGFAKMVFLVCVINNVYERCLPIKPTCSYVDLDSYTYDDALQELIEKM